MADAILNQPHFQDADKAREYLEALDEEALAETRVSEFLCNRIMSDTVAPNRRHHGQDATSHH